eukprot:TRINITY_DN2389_c0_g1_i2.p1 TRINITY_DN2389_c0_g1~~TRINITY_DN2389_c0_g1_i2.p1  ORF type:complete len:376 (-),score=88.02 TRINITY_DN2389_c0_g1_i2:286-1413(-)
MLSDRPSGKNDSGPRKSDGPPPFVAMVKPKDAIGLVPSKDIHRKKAKELNPALRTKNQASAVTKHKRWLKELQEMNRAARDEQMEQVVSLESKTQQFSKKQQKMRNALRKRVQAAEEAANIRAAQEDRRQQQEAGNEDVFTAPKPRRPAKVKQKRKPKWAMTEVEADDQDQAETEDLVNFAASLDFEQYLDDYEVRQALELVRQRVTEIEDAVEEEEYETDDEDAESEDGDNIGTDDNDARGEHKPLRRKKKKKALKIKVTDSTADAEKEAGWNQVAPNEVDSQKQVAQRILASSQSIRNVHSAASLQQVIAKKKAQGDARDRPLIPPGTQERKVLAEYQAGAAARHNANATHATNKSQDLDPNNLPYLHRNPAL